ncbi:hypothetical protein Bca4012_065865 [Brassica carinata]
MDEDMAGTRAFINQFPKNILPQQPINQASVLVSVNQSVEPPPQPTLRTQPQVPPPTHQEKSHLDAQCWCVGG